MKRKKKRYRPVDNEAAYVCDSCGEEIVIPIDRSAGDVQSYVEDCPVCCCPNEISISFEDDDEPRVSARAE